MKIQNSTSRFVAFVATLMAIFTIFLQGPKALAGGEVLEGEVGPVEVPQQVFGSVNDAPDTMPLTELSLFNYVRQSTRVGWASVIDDSILHNQGTRHWYYNWLPEGEPGTRESMVSLASGEVIFDTGSFENSVELIAGLETTEGHNHLFGSGEIRWYYNQEGRLEVESSLQLMMNEFIWIPSHGASGVRIIGHDRFGNPETYWLKVTADGGVWLPNYYVQEGGFRDQVIFTWPDGEAGYGVGQYGGDRRFVRRITASVVAELPESVPSLNTGALLITEQNWHENINPIVCLKVDERGSAGEIRFSGHIPKYPRNGGVEQWAESFTLFYPNGYESTFGYRQGEHANSMELPAGDYLVKYNFRSGFGTGRYNKPSNSSGKGG